MGFFSLFRSSPKRRRSKRSSKRRSSRSPKRRSRKRSSSRRRRMRSRRASSRKRRSSRSPKRRPRKKRSSFFGFSSGKWEINTMKECIHCVHLKDYLKQIGVKFGEGRKMEGKYPHTLYDIEFKGNNITMKEYSMRSAPAGSYPQIRLDGKDVSQDELKSQLN